MPRPLVMGRRAVVAAAHPLAAQAGIAVLQAGGNAVDAAIAANAAVGVVRPGSCGVGGDLFALVFDPRDGHVHFVNGSGPSPAAATVDAYRARGLSEMPANGPLSITVPGCVDGWHVLHQRFGRMPWRDLFAPAIALADDGYPITPPSWRSLSHMAKSADYPPAWHEAYARFLPDRPGGTYRIPQLGRALAAIAQGGRDAFYHGDIAKAMVATVQGAGGLLALDDLAAHASTFDRPLRVDYADHIIYQTPPNTQGLVTLIGLKVLEQLRGRGRRNDGGPGGIRGGEPSGGAHGLSNPVSARIHMQVAAYLEALKLRDLFVADPAWMPRPAASFLEAEALQRLADSIDLTRPATGPAGATRVGDTTALATADADGWVVVLIQSLFANMGSRVTVPGWGIVLQNRGYGFRLEEGHPNAVAPRKRPMHTLNASLVCRNGRPVIGFATEGGHLQAAGPDASARPHAR